MGVPGGFTTYRDYTIMYQKLIKENKNVVEVAERFKCHPDTIKNWAMQLEIKGLMPKRRGKSGERISLICQNCGKKFETHPYLKDKKYCSMKCFRESTKGRIGWNRRLQGIDPTKDNYDERIAKQAKSLRGKKAWNLGLKKENSKPLSVISKKLIRNTAFLSPKIKKIIRELKIENKTTSKDVWRRQRMGILAKSRATMEKHGNGNGGTNKFATAFFKYFDLRINTKGRYGINEKWIWNKVKNYQCRTDYFNEELRFIIEYDEEHHYNKKGELSKDDRFKQKVIQEQYPDFDFVRIREKNYFSKRKLLKDMTDKDYKIFDKIIEDIKAIIE